MDINEEKINWSAFEYEEKERSKDWFWALGIIIVTGAIAAIIFGDYSFAALLVLSGFLLGFFATKKPGVVSYELNNKGLKIDGRLYPYENIKSFWVQLPSEENPHLKPLLFIHSERIFLPVITLPIDEEEATRIHSFLLDRNIEEVEMKEHFSDKVMDTLGF